MLIYSIAKKSLIKFTKGIILCFGILSTTTFLVQSCKKTEVIIKDNAAQKFLTELKEHSKAINNITVNSINTQGNNSNNSTLSLNNSNYSTNSRSFSNDGGLTSAYINFRDMPITPNYSSDINGIANLVIDYQGAFSYNPSENSVQFSVSVETVNNSLLPLISAAKTYLNARGLTNSDIDDMLIAEDGQEVDLVFYAATLAKYEISGTTAKAITPNMFFGSAYAKDSPDILYCVAVALGVNHLWALGGSSASSWTKTAMKKAFGAVAKRALGPIGVAIAVVSFGLCMNGWSQ